MELDVPHFLKAIAERGSLSEEQSTYLFEHFLTNPEASISEAEVGAYLYSTAIRALTRAEVVGAGRVMRSKMIAVDVKDIVGGNCVLDTCGTGGSGLQAFNTSTAVSFVTASLGVYTAKHGNRAVSSQTGSADVLQALGLNIQDTAEAFRDSLKNTHFGFLFAPSFHPAARRVAPVRKQLGVRTIFNFLGPMLNPAAANVQIVGVSSKHMHRVIAEALLDLGIDRAMIVRGDDGLDEISLSSATQVFEIQNGEIDSYSIQPEQFGFSRRDHSELRCQTPDQSASLMRQLLGGKRGALSELVALNAGAALYLSGKSQSIRQGVEMAQTELYSGRPLLVLETLVTRYSRS